MLHRWSLICGASNDVRFPLHFLPLTPLVLELTSGDEVTHMFDVVGNQDGSTDQTLDLESADMPVHPAVLGISLLQHH